MNVSKWWYNLGLDSSGSYTD